MRQADHILPPRDARPLLTTPRCLPPRCAATECELGGLAPRSTYRLAVAAANRAGLGAFSASAAVQTNPAPDAPPQPPLAYARAPASSPRVAHELQAASLQPAAVPPSAAAPRHPFAPLVWAQADAGGRAQLLGRDARAASAARRLRGGRALLS